jgi:predicted ATPase
MRLAISGTAGQGKTTLLNEFLENWKMYTTPEKSYRSLLTTDNHSKNTSKETQWSILNLMLDQLEQSSSDDFVIFDRCPLDNLVHTMWAYHKNVGDIDELFVEKCIPIVRESMRLLDIIFMIPITNAAPADIQDDGVRETDADYIAEIDNFFKAMYTNWSKDDQRFFPKDDRTAIIEIFGTTEERIKLLGFYVDDSGKMFGEDDSLVDTNTLYDQFGIPVAADASEGAEDNIKIYK